MTDPCLPADTVPLEQYNLLRRKMIRFRETLYAIVQLLDRLGDDEQHDILQHTAPAPLDELTDRKG